MSKELISDFINKVISGDDSAKSAFSAFCSAKAKYMASGKAKQEMFESFKTELLEYTGDDASVSMDGDYIVVNGQRVGRVQTDLSDFDSGINFISAEGDFSKEFDTAEDLFKYISQRYLGEK